MFTADPAASWVRGLALLVAVLALFGSPSVTAASQGEVPVVAIRGVINPLSARYLSRQLESATRERAPLVLLELDTPGGTMNDMRKMVQDLLASPVPVAVYVAPPGAHAASAGVFITAAGHVAAMAPGTNIGSAHPVTLGRGGSADGVMEEKVLNDAAAMARAIAAARGRNAAWLEDAVRTSAALTAEEALAEGVVDVVAPDRRALLAAIDGREVQTSAGTRVLRTGGLVLVDHPMTLPERILHALTEPSIAYLLFSLGLMGLVFEFLSPGLLLPGVAGAICLILALVAFGSLPVNWAGALLVVLGLVLVIADALHAGIGLLSAGGAVAFLIGSLILYRPLGEITPATPDVRVAGWLIAALSTIFAGFALVVVRAAVNTRRAPVQTGLQALLGAPGSAISDLNPRGTVRVRGEVWSAVAEDPPVQAGDSVKVTGVAGVMLRIRREGV